MQGRDLVLGNVVVDTQILPVLFTETGVQLIRRHLVNAALEGEQLASIVVT